MEVTGSRSMVKNPTTSLKIEIILDSRKLFTMVKENVDHEDAIFLLSSLSHQYSVLTEEELQEPLETVKGEKTDHLCSIKVIVHKDDRSKELLEWGSRVAAANSRPANPQ